MTLLSRFQTTIAALLLCGGAFCHAEEPLRIANIVELTGPGASAGTNFKNGVELAIKEINATGGILGRPVQSVTLDTQSNPGVAKGLTQKVVDDDVFAIFGPVFSGSIMVSMAESRRAEIPNFTGGEAASITQQGNPYIFRTTATQAVAMPEVAHYLSDQAKVKSVALIYVNNDMGKGGVDMLRQALKATSTQIVAEIPTESGQVDFSSAVIKAKQSNAQAAFVYLNEEESARILRELRKQGWSKPIFGESTLAGQKVIDLAGDAANGVIAHVGLTVDANLPTIQAFRTKFDKEYHYVSDHNGMKGYSGMYVLKAAIEKVGRFDRKAVAATLHGISISAAKVPGVLLDVSYDGKGDLNRQSFMVEVKNGKQVVIATVPAVAPTVAAKNRP